MVHTRTHAFTHTHTHLGCGKLVRVAGDAGHPLGHKRLVQALRILRLVQRHHLDGRLVHASRSHSKDKGHHHAQQGPQARIFQVKYDRGKHAAAHPNQSIWSFILTRRWSAPGQHVLTFSGGCTGSKISRCTTRCVPPVNENKRKQSWRAYFQRDPVHIGRSP